MSKERADGSQIVTAVAAVAIGEPLLTNQRRIMAHEVNG